MISASTVSRDFPKVYFCIEGIALDNDFSVNPDYIFEVASSDFFRMEEFLETLTHSELEHFAYGDYDETQAIIGSSSKPDDANFTDEFLDAVFQGKHNGVLV